MKLEEFNSVSIAKVNSILNLLENYPKYNDEMNRQHIFIDNIDYDLSSNEFKQELETICFENGLNIGKDLVNKVISILSTRIRKNEKTLKLDVRVALDFNGDFLYQLSKKQMAVINDYGYSIVPIIKPIFKAKNTFKEQVEPVNNGSMEKLLKLFNINEDDRFLLQVYITSLFIPDISKPFLILTAEKGAGKSTATRIIKEIVDPSSVKSSLLPQNLEALTSRLERSYLICFDNIDTITSEQSNALCRACTGDASEKRALHTNNDAFVLSYIRPVIINGITCPALREDLLDRCIIFELKKVSKKDRLTDAEITNLLDNERPFVLSSIFNTLAKARVIKKKLKLEEKERLADWYEYAYCIAEAIEPNGGRKFKRIFKGNYERQNSMVINNNQIALTLKAFASRGGIGSSIELTSTELHKELLQTAYENNYKNFPKSPNWFIRELKRIISVLELEGIKVETIRKSDANYIRVTRIEKEW